MECDQAVEARRGGFDVEVSDVARLTLAFVPQISLKVTGKVTEKVTQISPKATRVRPKATGGKSGTRSKSHRVIESFGEERHALALKLWSTSDRQKCTGNQHGKWTIKCWKSSTAPFAPLNPSPTGRN
jgi:hypothetical protein